MIKIFVNLLIAFERRLFLTEEGWYRLGLVLYKMGQFQKSQQVYEVLLEQATNESDKAPIYNQLGLMKDNQGEYKEAITFYEKSLEIYKTNSSFESS